MLDSSSNGYREGVTLWNTWGKIIVPVVMVVFAFSAAWFSLLNRVQAVEQANDNIVDDISEIKSDVRWMRQNWSSR